MKPLILIAACVAGVVACDDVSGPGSIPAGAWAYTGYDAAGAVAVRGWLTLNLQDPTRVTGTWHLESVGSAQNIGPQTGDGRLEGQMEGDVLAVDLNPGVADNNVGLSGTLEGTSYRGRWAHVGFAGPLNDGTFEAFRR